MFLRNGGVDRDRTCDLLIANETLYQLSYDPTQKSRRLTIASLRQTQAEMPKLNREFTRTNIWLDYLTASTARHSWRIRQGFGGQIGSLVDGCLFGLPHPMFGGPENADERQRVELNGGDLQWKIDHGVGKNARESNEQSEVCRFGRAGKSFAVSRTLSPRVKDCAADQRCPSSKADVTPFGHGLKVVLMGVDPSPVELLAEAFGEVGEGRFKSARAEAPPTGFWNHFEADFCGKES